MLSNTSNMEKKLPLQRDLDDVLVDLKINNSERTRNKAIVTSFWKRLKSEFIKLDYGDIYKDIIFTGSFYESLRNDSATEFDLNIVLNLPFKVKFIPPQQLCDSVYVKCQLEQCLEDSFPPNITDKMKNVYKSFFDHQYFLIPDKVRHWFQGIIEIISFTHLKDVEKVKTSESGPARTVHLLLTNNTTIDIDLVPVFKFQKCHGYEPNGFTVGDNILKAMIPECYDWVLVPKPYKMAPDKNKIEQIEPDKFLWRQHMYYAEKYIILRNNCCLKPVTRLIKALRDAEKWHYLCSYFIKTVVLLKYEQKYKEDSYWVNKNMPQVFMDLLELLLESLNSKTLQCFFFPEHNLFSSVNPITLQNYHDRLNRIMKKIPIQPKMYLRPELQLKAIPEANDSQFNSERQTNNCRPLDSYLQRQTSGCQIGSNPQRNNHVRRSLSQPNEFYSEKLKEAETDSFSRNVMLVGLAGLATAAIGGIGYWWFNSKEEEKQKKEKQ